MSDNEKYWKDLMDKLDNMPLNEFAELVAEHDKLPGPAFAIEDKPLRLMTIAVEDWEQLRRERDKLKPWAELGKLAVEAACRLELYNPNDYNLPCKSNCMLRTVCQKRKELKGVE